MKTLVKNEFRQTRKTLLIWLGIMLLLCGFCYFELLSLKDSLDEMARTVGQFPRLIMIMFGVKGDLTTALGWYACIYFWEGLLVFAYYDAAHTSRFLFYYPYLLRHHGDDTGRRRLATMYLLTATESLCRAVPNIFGLWSIRLSGWDTVRAMSEQEYVLYQAAKGLYQNHQYISFQELCDRELVDDTALTLILDAMLIAHYGKAMFTIGGTGGEV